MWRNAETSKQLEVKPEKGKAVLFYNMLPDGNYDELSMHAALPVKKGEKWLANLWVWVSLVTCTLSSSKWIRVVSSVPWNKFLTHRIRSLLMAN